MTTHSPDRPWERGAADTCEVDLRNYLVVVDRFPRFIVLAYLPDMTGTTARSRFTIFDRWGCVTFLVTGNGPHFSGHQFQHFAKCR